MRSENFPLCLEKPGDRTIVETVENVDKNPPPSSQTAEFAVF
jgi:hypothetical protein